MRPTWDVGRAARPCSALLRVGFAEPPESPRALVRSYRTVSPLPVPRGAIGGLFSVALSCGSPRLAASQHPALWSPDLPRPGHAGPRPPGRLAAHIVPRTRTIPHKCRPTCQPSSPLGTAERSDATGARFRVLVGVRDPTLPRRWREGSEVKGRGL